jgi:hypothetical protein
MDLFIGALLVSLVRVPRAIPPLLQTRLMSEADIPYSPLVALD